MEKVKISVIATFYCGEKYVQKCLNCLINQTFKNLEIICINDGSTDNTLNLLEEYKNNYKNITIINKKNEGIFKARILRN